jgi:N-acetylglutamate synthase/N-acetylornithine aminotransferase
LSELEGIDDYSRVEIFIQSGEKKVVLFEDERKIFLLDDTIREALNAEDVTLCVRIGRGNYASTSYGTALFQK